MGAPDLQAITSAYETQFGHPVVASGRSIDRVPQLEIQVPTEGLVGLDLARRRLFRGESIAEDYTLWRELLDRLAPIERAHLVTDPPIYFPATAAAAIAVSNVRQALFNANISVRLTAYHPLSIAQSRDLSSVINTTMLGKVLRDKMSGDGHLFRFSLDDKRDVPNPALAHVTIVDLFGIRWGSEYKKSGLQLNKGHPGKVLMTRPTKPPTILEASPPVKTVPESHRIQLHVRPLPDRTGDDTSRFSPRTFERSVLEKKLGQTLREVDGSVGWFALDIDLTDIHDFPEMKQRLYECSNLAADQEKWFGIARRIWNVLQGCNRVRLSETAAIVLGLFVVHDPSINAGRSLSLDFFHQRIPTTFNGRIKELRFGASIPIHPYVIEKRPFDIQWSEQDHPRSAPPQDVLFDGGLALSFHLNGEKKRILIEN